MITDKLKPIGATSTKETVRVSGIVKSASSPGGGSGETDPTVAPWIKTITEEERNRLGEDWLAPGQHIQLSPSTAWVVVHNLGRPPVGLSVFDSSGRAVGCKVEHDELTWNSFTVRPGNPVGGRVTWI